MLAINGEGNQKPPTDIHQCPQGKNKELCLHLTIFFIKTTENMIPGGLWNVSSSI